MPQSETDVLPETQDELRKLAESIIDTYEMRVRTICGMMKQAYELLRSHEEVVGNKFATLRDRMARERSLRHHDFDEIAQHVVAARAHRGRQISEQLEAFEKEEQEMTARLCRIVAAGGASDPSEMAEIREDILTRQKNRERRVTRALREFEIEGRELQAVLESLLDTGQKATVAGLRDMVRTLTARWKAGEKDVFSLVEQLEETRNRALSRWQQVMVTSSQFAMGQSGQRS